MKKVFKVFKKIIDVLCWITIAVLVILLVLSFISHVKGTTPSLFGYSVYRVSSGSMEPELMVGDVILGKTVDDPMTLEVGDIVTYKGSGELQGKLITHQIIVAPCEENGKIMLQTKGVANNVADSPIEADRVISVVICKIQFLNEFYNFFFSPWGLLTIIALIIIVFIDELIILVKTIMRVDTTKKDDVNIKDIIGRIQTEDIPDIADEVTDEVTNDGADEFGEDDLKDEEHKNQI